MRLLESVYGPRTRLRYHEQTSQSQTEQGGGKEGPGVRRPEVGCGRDGRRRMTALVDGRATIRLRVLSRGSILGEMFGAGRGSHRARPQSAAGGRRSLCFARRRRGVRRRDASGGEMFRRKTSRPSPLPHVLGSKTQAAGMPPPRMLCTL
jgi:hypothetical protein